MTDLRQTIASAPVETLADLRQLVDVILRASISTTLPVRINGKLRRSLGRFVGRFTSDGIVAEGIEFAPDILRLPEAVRREIVAHECAHAIVTIRLRRDVGHGLEWRMVMMTFGVRARTVIPPYELGAERATAIAQKQLARRVCKIEVRCGCGRSYLLTPRRAARVVGRECARCRVAFRRAA